MRKNTYIFKNPQKSRILWHDVKKFPSIVNIYLGNIESGIYGKVPAKLTHVLDDLHAAAVQDILFVENISILYKIELKSLSLKQKKLMLSLAAKLAISFVTPVCRSNGVKIGFSIPQKSFFTSDERYGSTILHNMLFLALYFHAGKQNIMLTSKTKGVEVTTNTKMTDTQVQTILSKKNLDDPNNPDYFLPSLLYYSSGFMANELNHTFDISVKNNQITILYAKK